MRVDNSAQVNSRRYTGFGIYRDVWLELTSPVHVAPWGVFVRMEAASEERAAVRVQTMVRNPTASAEKVTITTVLIDSEKKLIARHEATALVEASEALLEARLMLDKEVAPISLEGRVVDETRTMFGICMVSVSPERGFELNGKSVKLNGANVHHDHSQLGAAVFCRAERARMNC